MNYLFYIQGLAREVWVRGTSERDAHDCLWHSLSAAEKDVVQYMECIDCE